MSAYIKAISYYTPNQVLTNENLVREFPEWTVEKVASKVGIHQRYIADADETAGDMALKAAEKLFMEHEIERNDVDFVLLCTQSPDYFLPSTACVLQDKLGLRQDIGAFDFNLGCSGFVYGLSVAKGLIAAGIARNILLLTSETYTKYLHPKDKGNRTIFGDAASATLISTTGFAEIGDFVLGTDGSGYEQLIVKSGASRTPHILNDVQYDENGNPTSSDHLFMNGPDIFTFTIERVPTMVRVLLEKSRLTKDDIHLFIPHQANLYILEFLRKKMKIEKEKYYINLANLGNTVSSTIPIALYEAKHEGLLHGNILLAGFGVGLSWCGAILNVE